MRWFRARRGPKFYGQIVSDITPSISTAELLVNVCQVQETPAAVLEAGIAELFAVHRSVLAAASDENDRMAILPNVHDHFVAAFASISRQLDLSEKEMVDLVVRRLAAYDAFMDTSIPQWQYKLAQEVYENVARQTPDTAVALVVGIPLLKEMNETTKFLREALK